MKSVFNLNKSRSYPDKAYVHNPPITDRSKNTLDIADCMAVIFISSK